MASDVREIGAVDGPSQARSCFSCGSPETFVFYEADGIPVNSCLLISTREEALSFPRGDMRLAFCASCGFVFNAAFDPGSLEYSQAYEETQGFSAHFQAFARKLATRLIERHDLHGKAILEIGCGKGEFLALLCEIGDNRGIGIDPAYVDGRLPADIEERVSFIRDFYSPAYAHLTADLVACRHTLEHIQTVRELVSMVQGSLRDRPDSLVFFEVPDVRRVLKESAFWDIYYEHCSYFSLGSLTRLFRSCGFDVLHATRDFDDQYLLLEARVANEPGGLRLPGEDDLDELALQVEGFSRGCAEKMESWKHDLQRVRARGQRAVLWGAGSKAVAYLTTLGEVDEVGYLVDVNPFKQGKYIAGTGHEVVAPRFLETYKPDVVIVMNPVYRGEIRRDLEGMGLCPELIALE